MMLKGLAVTFLLLHCWNALALQQCTTNQYNCENTLSGTICDMLRQSYQQTYGDMCTQMDDIAKQCLRTCGMCCHDTRYNCEDHPAAGNMVCGTFKQFGMCVRTHSFFDDVARLCPHTCGACDFNGDGDCQDIESLTYCRNMRKFCYDNSDLGHLVNARCKWTCGCNDPVQATTTVVPSNWSYPLEW